MNQHDTADRQVIPAQFISFLLAGVIGLLGDALLNRPATTIAFKFADAIFITGCILVAMKLARKGWDLPAAGYTVLSIAWGGFFLAKDFASQEMGRDIAGSVFYFLLPSLILIALYRPFPLWIKLLTLAAMLPSLLQLIVLKTDTLSDYENLIRKLGFTLIHLISLVWGSFFYWQYQRDVTRSTTTNKS